MTIENNEDDKVRTPDSKKLEEFLAMLKEEGVEVQENPDPQNIQVLMNPSPSLVESLRKNKKQNQAE